MLILLIIILYFALLLVFSWFTSGKTSNDAFFCGEKKSPWYMVAFGMIGASISGITFISVPGMAMLQDMTYLQTCLGFIIGYMIVAFVLLPLYYRLNLTTIYSYLDNRLGRRSYTTGAAFFILSKLSGAAVRFYVICMLMQRYVLDDLGVPFFITVPIMVMLIWLYTRRSGIKTIVWTDTLQTAVMFTALILIIIAVINRMEMTLPEAINAIAADEHSRIFVFDDWSSPQNFWKQFLSGIFIVIVMTGLDQDMMQKNLTCKSLGAAKKNLCTYGLAFVPANLLFLSLGVLLIMLTQHEGLALPDKGDELLPMFAATGTLGTAVLAFFVIGIVASAFSSADSALTALTTSVCVDIFRRPDDTTFRRKAHLGIVILFIISVIIFDSIGSKSVINAIYIMCGYTYGPLLGLFAYGILTHHGVRDRYVPYICIASPLICFIIDTMAQQIYNYHFGYELLMLNGMITFAALYAVRTAKR